MTRRERKQAEKLQLMQVKLTIVKQSAEKAFGRRWYELVPFRLIGVTKEMKAQINELTSDPLWVMVFETIGATFKTWRKFENAVKTISRNDEPDFHIFPNHNDDFLTLAREAYMLDDMYTTARHDALKY